jgi:O-antigen/teichoic acid export membrane protein
MISLASRVDKMSGSLVRSPANCRELRCEDVRLCSADGGLCLTAVLNPKKPADDGDVHEVVNATGVHAVSENGSEPRSLTANTLIMYGRTLLTMAVSLYSSRVVLAQLGAVDYGIYFAVAGVTFLVAFLNSALAASTQRHLSAELALRDSDRLRTIFSASLQIHAAIAVAVFLACETIGMWFLHSHMSIPPERMQAATWAFHCAAFTVALTVLQVPYNALLAAAERFSAYAAFDIAHAFLRLLIALALIFGAGDRLELFASLMVVLVIVIFLAKVAYCWWSHQGSRYRPCADVGLARSLAGFAGWSLVEVLSIVLNIHGFGLLLNLHFGPIANASQGVAVQLVNATSTLASNLQITATPRIMKSYFLQDASAFEELVTRNAKAAFFLMLIIVVPVGLEADAVLATWLGDVPQHTTWMVRILLITGLVNSLSSPLVSVIQATGKIRRYQLIVGGLMLTAVPVGAVLLAAGAEPTSLFWFLLFLSSVALAFRVHMVSQLTGLSRSHFVRQVLVPASTVTLLSFAASLFAGMVMSNLQFPAICRFFGAFVATATAIYLLGFSDQERSWLRGILRTRLSGLQRVST